MFEVHDLLDPKTLLARFSYRGQTGYGRHPAAIDETDDNGGRTDPQEIRRFRAEAFATNQVQPVGTGAR